ncbi:TonB-dependent receptor [Chryseolinea sp. H1M3-3]|uniref:TonB-dependent receptor n=1 Tax=Chryseolinea sp. H1M3-3 TaxID=3034144 RepID=UPI0023EB3452|nr:TonB-dependent receptor [Chryseolinea sp. H1M3-3]
MHKIWSSFFLFSLLVGSALAQNDQDTTRILNEIVIKGYAYNRPADEVPAAVAVVNQKDFERFNNTSFLPAVNTIPGVRMEERSPGSYRFSIRGSLLRSPFGVRNVKVYWNGLPFTDGGGNTYLNLLDFSSVGNMEIIKGPGGSLYGAGTGGVVLLQSPTLKTNQLQFSSVFGSYGLQRYHLSGETHSKKTDIRFHYAHQQSDGYREQTAMRRDGISGDLTFRLSNQHTLAATLFYTNLFYETPGGLNKAQYDANPRQARPASPVTRGAVEQQATVTNKTGYIGFIDDYQWNDAWSTQTGIYGSLTSFENPTIRNYESRDEQNFGLRTQTQYVFEKTVKGKFTFGGEYQYFNSPITVYGNSYGVIDTVQTDDKLKSSVLLFFVQAELDLTNNFFITVGASANFLKYNFTTLYPAPTINQKRNFDPVLSPRLALLKKFNRFSVYASVSQGFSPPSLAEVRPSAGSYNNDLKSERGLNFEAGLRGNLLQRQLQFDIAVYDFRLDETIVIQRTADGAEFFVNAGKTAQRGLEASLSWSPDLSSEVISSFSLWSSYTYNHYRFKDYENDGNNFSGKRLTGVAPTIVLWGADISFKKFYANITANYTEALPLNDANTQYASDYFLLSGRIGYKTVFGKNLGFEVFAGIDNALDKRYSLGNDLNAIGGRYYNTAAPRNIFGGIKITPSFNRKD